MHSLQGILFLKKHSTPFGPIFIGQTLGITTIVNYCSKDGVKHIFQLISKSRYLSTDLKEIVDPAVQRNSFFATQRISGVAREGWGRGGAARPGCHHFGVTPYYDVKP